MTYLTVYNIDSLFIKIVITWNFITIYLEYLQISIHCYFFNGARTDIISVPRWYTCLHAVMASRKPRLRYTPRKKGAKVESRSSVILTSLQPFHRYWDFGRKYDEFWEFWSAILVFFPLIPRNTIYGAHFYMR